MKTPGIQSETVNNLRLRQKKIIAAIDFTVISDHAAHLASQFAKLHGSELILLTVIEKPMGLGDLFRDKEADEKHKAVITQKLEKLAALYSSNSVKTSVMVLEGKPHKEIVKASESIMAEMIVLGTSGAETGEHNYIGSNVYSIVRMANCPVVTVNHHYKKRDIKNILIPVDPGFGIRELRVLMEVWGESSGAKLCLTSLVPEGSNRKPTVEAYLKKQAETLHNHGITNVTTLVVESKEITNGILQIVNTDNYDMIRLETHGRSGISNLLEGSVTEEILFYSPVPVLSLRPVREPSHIEYYHSNLPI